MTQDLDVVVAASSTNFDSLASAVVDIDARILGPDGQRSVSSPSAELLASGEHWRLTSDHGLLDVVTAPAHPGSFDEIRSRAHEVKVDDFIVPIAAREDLLVLKRAAGRPRDLADIDLLEALESEISDQDIDR